MKTPAEFVPIDNDGIDDEDFNNLYFDIEDDDDDWSNEDLEEDIWEEEN
jgi:hypothetical protein